MKSSEIERVDLVGLRVSNYQRLEGVELRFSPSAGIVEITGRNRQGKSTLIDAIWDACKGRKPKNPVHDGQPQAMVAPSFRVTMNDGTVTDLEVTRRWWCDEPGQVKTSLHVKVADGALKLTSPQSVLNTLMTEISTDPIKWVRLAERGLPGRREQAEQLIAGLGLEVPELVHFTAQELEVPIAGMNAMDAIEAVRASIVEARRDLNRRAKAVDAQLDGLRDATETTSVDVSELGQRLAEAHAGNEELRQAKQAAAVAREAYEQAEVDRKETLDAHPQELQELVARHDRERKELDERHDREAILAEERSDTLGDELNSAEQAAVGDFVDVTPIEKELAESSATNERASRWQTKSRLGAERMTLNAEVEAAEGELLKLSHVQGALLRDAQLPEGVGFDSVGGLTFNGQPFPDQASHEEQISVAVAVAALSQPKLKLLRVHNGEALDSEHRAALGKVLKETGFTGLVEMVDESGEVGIVIEDGKVAADNREETDGSH